jgi:FtsZ-binding cell division protein ZapB
MATIRIDSSTLQDHFEDSCSINVTAFGWSTYSGVTDVEYDVEVGDELAYDDDDYIEIEEYNELKDSLQEMVDEFEKSQDELATVQAELVEMKAAWDYQIAQGALKEAQIQALMAVIAAHKPWYKFW